MSVKVKEYEIKLKEKDEDYNGKLLQRDNRITKLSSEVGLLRNEMTRLNESFSKLLSKIADVNPTGFLSWKISNCCYLRTCDEAVWSPPFYTSFNGYKCQLYAKFCGPQGGRLELCFYLLHDENFENLRWPFRFPVTYICYSIHNVKVSFTDDPNGDDGYCDIWDIIPGVSRSGGALIPHFLSMPQLSDFIINDTITIECHIETK